MPRGPSNKHYKPDYTGLFIIAGLLLGVLGFWLAITSAVGCTSQQNREAAAVLANPDPCFVIARDPQHITCLHGARPVNGHPQYRGKLPNE